MQNLRIFNNLLLILFLSFFNNQLKAAKIKNKKNNFNLITQQVNDLEKKLRKLEQRLELLESSQETKTAS